MGLGGWRRWGRLFGGAWRLDVTYVVDAGAAVLDDKALPRHRRSWTPRASLEPQRSELRRRDALPPELERDRRSARAVVPGRWSSTKRACATTRCLSK